MRKAIIDSQPHERVLERARTRIESELAKRRSSIQSALDSAHLEQAFQHHIDRYGNDGLIRMALMLRSANPGHVQQSDIDLLNHLPFNISYKIDELPVRARTGERVQHPRISLHNLWKKLSEWEQFQKMKERRDNSMNEISRLIHKNNQVFSQRSGDYIGISYFLRKFDELEDDFRVGKMNNDEFNSKKRHLTENLFFQYPHLFQSGFWGITQNPEIFELVKNIEELHKKGFRWDDGYRNHIDISPMQQFFLRNNPDNIVNKIKLLMRDYDNAVKKSEEKLKTFTDNDQLPQRIRDAIIFMHDKSQSSYGSYNLEPNSFFKPVPWSAPDPSRTPHYHYINFPDSIVYHQHRGFIAKYNPLKFGLKTDIMDWLKRFRPEFSKTYGPYKYGYHASIAGGNYGIIDPVFFKSVAQHYGIGLYMSMIPYLARTIGRDNRKFFAKIPIPKSMKFLENDKDYGSTKQGKELLNNVSKYFDDLCEKMGLSHKKGLFHTALEETLKGEPGMRWVNGSISPNIEKDSQRYRDELTDRMGFRGMHVIDALTHQGSEPYDPFDENDMIKKPEHKIYIGKNIDGSPSMNVPGWALHRAIKLGFEMLGAPTSSNWAPFHTNRNNPNLQNTVSLNNNIIIANPNRQNDDSVGEYDDTTPWRNSSYHAGLLLSSLGFHGYKHYDPETDSMLTNIGHLPEGTTIDRSRAIGTQKGFFQGTIPKSIQGKIKSIVLFPSAISDLPLIRWSLSRTPRAERESTSVFDEARERPTHVPGIPATRGERGRFTTSVPSAAITPRGPVPLRSGPIQRIDQP